MTIDITREQVTSLADWHEQRGKLAQYEEDAQAHEATATMLRDLWTMLAAAFRAAEPLSTVVDPADNPFAKPPARARKRAH